MILENEPWLYALASVIIISLVSLIGVFSFSINKNKIKKWLLFLVSFSAGSLLGGAFLHLLPESFENYGFGLEVGLFLLLGIIFFFILEKFIQWRHCHIPDCKHKPHTFAYMNLVGDGLHNFLDGVTIGATYLISTPLGITASIAVLLHEIPQEIGDFGVLVHGGFSRKKALMINFLTAATAIVGAVVGLILGDLIENFTMYIVPFAAGGFIYVAGSDLIPELHKEREPSKSLLQLFGILLGIGVMVALLFLE